MENLVKISTLEVLVSVQHKVQRGGSGTAAGFVPAQTVTPGSPQPQGAAGDFIPAVTNEEEAVRVYPRLASPKSMSCGRCPNPRIVGISGTMMMLNWKI